jgi:hypothetical protein
MSFQYQKAHRSQELGGLHDKTITTKTKEPTSDSRRKTYISKHLHFHISSPASRLIYITQSYQYIIQNIYK